MLALLALAFAARAPPASQFDASADVLGRARCTCC